MTITDNLATVDSRLFRDTMGSFATGVAVITTEHEAKLQGMTINSLTSLSTNPPKLIICLTEGTRTANAVLGRKSFVVNILTEAQKEISGRFAKPGEEHFAGLETDFTDSGLPVLRGTAATFECEVDSVLDGGDHHIVVGRVISCVARQQSPLLFHKGSYQSLNAAAVL